MATSVSSKDRKLDRERKRLEYVLEKLKQGVAIVEGKHDKAVMQKLGVNCITFDSLLRSSRMPNADTPVFILTDNDKGGFTKMEGAVSALLNTENNYRIDTSTAGMLFRVTRKDRIEEIYDTAHKLLDRA